MKGTSPEKHRNSLEKLRPLKKKDMSTFSHRHFSMEFVRRFRGRSQGNRRIDLAQREVLELRRRVGTLQKLGTPTTSIFEGQPPRHQGPNSRGHLVCREEYFMIFLVAVQLLIQSREAKC